MCAALQFAVPGVPSVYYGDEQGMEGVGDPFNRAPFKEGDQDLHDWYAYLSNLRRGADALSTGKASFFASDSEVLLILRYITAGHDVFGDPAENSVWLCVINRSDEAREYSVDCADAGLGVHTGTAAPLSGELIRLL
jgi:4-alpha-glucanotransferase